MIGKISYNRRKKNEKLKFDSGDSHFLGLYPNLTSGMHPLKIFTLKIWQSVGLMLLEIPLLGRSLFILLGMSTQR